MHSDADYRLRPMEEADLALILAWRNSDRVRLNMYTDHLITPEEHARWFAAARSDERGRYLVFEDQSRPLGFVSFTGITVAHGRCTWAFYIGEPDVLRGTGSAMEMLALDYAFGPLNIRKLCCEVLDFNASVVKLHKRFGFQEEGLLRQHYRKGERYADVVVMARMADTWPEERAVLYPKIFQASEVGT
jgi:UDP-4-amino-4,6-dideoxy-N-acetyl-beta-L-altrosamine N-acetyltransferase